MSTSISFNGVSYSVPSSLESRGWGTSLSNYLISVSQNALSKSGGTFTLTQDVNFGATYGVVAKYLKSSTADIAQSEVIRLANNEGIATRNAANGADLVLKANASDLLEFDGNEVAILDVADSTELSYLAGVTSAIQTQLDGKLDDSQLLDEDNMASDSATSVPSQQSVKAYADTKMGLAGTETVTGAKTFTDNVVLDNQKAVRFEEQTGNGDNYIALKAPDAVTTSTTFKLPDGDGSANQVLKTDASGNLGWATVAAGIGTNYGVHAVSSANYTILDADGYRTILVTTGASDRTITLPTAADNTDRSIRVLKVDSGAGNVIVVDDATDSALINGAASVTISGQYGGIDLVCDGSTWNQTPGLATPTQSGLTKAEKQYIHGTDFTVTSSSAGTEVFSRGVAVPYQTYDGAWRMKFNIQFTHDADGAYTITIPDVVFKNVTDYRQMVGFMGSNSSYSGRVFTNPNTATISVQTNTSNTETSISGDVELNSKPTWAD